VNLGESVHSKKEYWELVQNAIVQNFVLMEKLIDVPHVDLNINKMD
jgi:hypothetical protein